MALYPYCIPNFYVDSIKEIDYSLLKKQGKTTLFFDLDNTIMSYDETTIAHDISIFLTSLLKDFDIVIVSNSGFQRVSKACKESNLNFIHSAKKPLKIGFNKALRLAQSKAEHTVFIGDQLMTDILGSNRLGMTSILVFPVKKRSDHIFTRINRKLEKHMIKKIMKFEYKRYDTILRAYVERSIHESSI
jgi:HAD superfamily phosphatase (TIGR01668 family)